MNEQKSKKIGMEMNILMSVSLSLCLSLTGTLSSGQFTILGFLESFGISLAISFVLGLFISIPRIHAALEQKLHLQKGSMVTRIVETLVSDLIYTPILSVIMITLGWFTARAHGVSPPYVPMLLKGMGLSLFVGFLLIFMFTPVFLKLVLKRNGIPMDEQK